jgi:serine/threonine protein kinase
MNPNDTRLAREEVIGGTLEYLPPEILCERYEYTDISKQDLWSIGVIAYQLCTLRLPFKSEIRSYTNDAIINNPHDPIPH